MESPVPSITCAPAGTATFAPTAWILPAEMTTVPLAISGPLTGKIFAFLMAKVPWGPGVGLYEPSCACARLVGVILSSAATTAVAQRVMRGI